ncbi:MAG: transglycosylase domain-containing protein [Bacteroidales bacterium]|nr:transglycosylase domain-containing protein [Bacteroidales bacterium]
MKQTDNSLSANGAPSNQHSRRFWVVLSASIVLALCLLCYLLMPVFAKSYIRKKLASEAEVHHWEMSVDNIKVSQYHPRNGFTCSFRNLLICRENTQDTMLYVDAISAKVALAFKGGLHVTTRDIESDYAYFSFQNVKDTVNQQNNGAEKDYPHKLKKMLQAFTEFFPEQLSSRKIVLATQKSDGALQYDIDSLTIYGDSLSGHCTQIANDTMVRFQISGHVQPRENLYNGHITLVDNPCNDHVRLLKDRLNTEFLCDDLSFGLRIDQNSSNNASLTLSGQVKNALVDNPKISEQEVLVENASFDLDVRLSEKSITIDSSSVMKLNGLAIHPFFFYEKKKESHIVMSVNEKGIDMRTFFGALPKELFTVASKLKMSGKMDFSAIFDCDFAHIDDLKFNFALKSHDLALDKSTLAFFGKYEQPFDYPCYEGDTLLRIIHIDPAEPTFCSFAQIPHFLKYAILASEDASFFTHRGFIKSSIRDAMVTNLKKHRFVRGGSTISMQLVKNLFLNRKKHFARKIEEMLLVWLIEENRLLEKERMFEIYVNIVEWAPCVYGIVQAADFYFDKKPEQLTFGECVYLATLIRSPKMYEYTLNSAGEVGNGRRSEMRFVAQRMLDREMITEAEHAQFSSFVATNISEEKVETFCQECNDAREKLRKKAKRRK